MILRVLLFVLVLAAPASAATRYEIIDDCSDDSRLSGDYTAAELRDARKNLEGEVAEYTDCADVLRRAELALVERSGGGPPVSTGSGGGQPPEAAPLVPADDAERVALREARTAPAPVAVRGRAIEPGSAGFTPGAIRNEMPISLQAAVFGLLLLFAWGLWGFVRRGTGEAMGNDLWRPIP